ncbi:MAG TPA: NAD+ synthase [Egibacteraceae bacterium]
MRLALVQLNPVVGDVRGNAERIATAYRDAAADGADLVAVGELALTGYPPEDLVLRPAFLDAIGDALRSLAAATGDAALVVGFVEHLPGDAGAGEAWRAVASEATLYPPLANSAAVLRRGRVDAVYRKQRLPNYGVFDEARYFRAGTRPLVVDVAGVRVGITVCEDLWGEGGPVPQAAAAGAQVVLNVDASPYHRGKRAERERWARHHAAESRVWLPWLNLVGGQDEVVFDGDSFVVDPRGEVVARAAQFRDDVLVVDVDVDAGTAVQIAGDAGERLDPIAEVYAALVLGVRDYARKNGFSRAAVGLSGGIDSALVAVVAADALGADALTCVSMPSPYSSPGSVTDAQQLAANLGARWLELPIGDVMKAYEEVLAEPFAGVEPDVTEENLQARIRGNLLMALSNKFGDLVLATGNKSESAVGYATLYGDMAGGFAPIKDVGKLLVYELCRYVNREREVVPQAIIDKPPSAELRPGQLDTDALPPYEVLDPILEGYVEQDRSLEDLVAAGFDRDTVAKVVRLVDRAEYKRRQAAPGIKITPKAFGKDRRMPITQRWSG